MDERRAALVMLGIPLAVAALAPAIYFAVRDDNADGATATTAAEESTTTASTTTSTTTTTAPELSPEDEIRRAAAALFELRDEIIQSDPRRDRILDYAEDQSPLYANDARLFDRMQSTGARWAGGDPGEVLGVRLQSFDPRSPGLTIVRQGHDSDIVDPGGQVLQHLPAGRSAYSISLLGSAGSWKINDFLVLDQILPSVVEEIVAEGVP
ncbi:MAG: hypothetical protein ACRD29_21240 [Acidimicrobiales bacterium]